MLVKERLHFPHSLTEDVAPSANGVDTFKRISSDACPVAALYKHLFPLAYVCSATRHSARQLSHGRRVVNP